MHKYKRIRALATSLLKYSRLQIFEQKRDCSQSNADFSASLDIDNFAASELFLFISLISGVFPQRSFEDQVIQLVDNEHISTLCSKVEDTDAITVFQR